MKRLVACLVFTAAACAGSPDSPEVTVEIVEPADGAALDGSSVRVAFAITGIEIVPIVEQREGTGHHHLFVDTELSDFSQPIPGGVDGILHFGAGQTEVTLENLEPGEHVLIAVVADWQHVPLDPAVVDTVRFTVNE